MNYRILLVVSLSLLMSLNLLSQSLSGYTIAELKVQKQKAIENEDYALASKIKKEIEFREAQKNKKATLEEALKKAVREENYEEAAKIKEELDAYNLIQNIDAEIKQAVAEEDFKKAQMLQERKTQLSHTPKSDNTLNKVEPTTKASSLAETKQPTEAKNATAKPNVEQKKKFLALNKRGISLGFNLGSLSFSDPKKVNKVEYTKQIGFFAEINEEHNIKQFHNNFSLNLDMAIGISNLRFKIENPLNEYSLTYLTTAAGIKVKIWGFGVALGYFLDRGLWGTQYQASNDTKYKAFKDDFFKDWNYGVNWKWSYSTKKIAVFFDYKIGIANIEGKDDSGGKEKSRLSALCFGFTYWL